MKTLGNAAAFLIAVGVMCGLIQAQHNYQNSWREPTIIEMASSPATPAPANQYSVVMK
jgi:hypothetical protein